MDDQLLLETPEQIEINFDIARLGSRFIAVLWDTSALILLQVMLFFAGFILIDQVEALGPAVSNWGLAILVLLGFVLFWGYYVIFELIWNGQTPGKRLAGIRTVRLNGQPISFTESAIRNVVRIADLLPGVYGLGVLIMFLDKRSRRLGDFAAGTLVVHDHPPVPLELLSPKATLDQRLLEPALPNLERLTLDEIEAMRRFLQRRNSLSNADALAVQFASRVRQRLELEPPVPHRPNDDLLLLRQVVAQHGQEKPVAGSP